MKVDKRQNPYSDVVIGKIPLWITRWGVIIIFCILALLTMYCNTISYPQIIARQILLIENSPSVNDLNIYEVKGEMLIVPDEIVNIKKDMKVNIKLNAYSPTKYGVILGIVDTIEYSDISAKYIVSIRLPNGLVTNYGAKITYTKGLTGMGNVVISETTLLDRILQPIRTLYHHK